MNTIIILCVAALCVVWAWTLRVIVKTLQRADVPVEAGSRVHQVSVKGHSHVIKPAARKQAVADEENSSPTGNGTRSKMGVPQWDLEG